MGIFDFLKKPKKKEILETEQIPPSSVYNNGKSLNEIYAEKLNASHPGNDVFELIKTYSEYVVSFVNMQLQNNYSPIAAYQKNNGEIVGYLYVTEDMSYSKSVEETLMDMETEFEKRMNEKTIQSYILFYHSKFNDNDDHSVARRGEDFKAISVKYKSNKNVNGYLGFPYIFQEDTIIFKGFSSFSRDQNASILNTQLVENKNYFQEQTIIAPQLTENEIGLKIKKVNNGSLGDMWGGIFGYDTLNAPRGKQLLLEYSALGLSRETTKSNKDVLISEINYDAIIFRGVKTTDDTTHTIFPVVKTDYYITVENKEIAEWENANNVEAVISGSGRDSFGLRYFATDYAINKEKYHSTKTHAIELSGIIYTVDKSDINTLKTEGGPNYSEDFTMYMPNKEMSELGCFDFIGMLEDFRALNILEDKSAKGYILKMKLITKEDDPDFFTIDMFVNKENMRFENLSKGMKLTGLFQLQGQIKE